MSLKSTGDSRRLDPLTFLVALFTFAGNSYQVTLVVVAAVASVVAVVAGESNTKHSLSSSPTTSFSWTPR